MTIIVQDSFTDTDATQLQAHTGETGATWAKVTGFTGNLDIVAGILQDYGDSATSSYYASGVFSSADCDAQVDYSHINSIYCNLWLKLRLNPTNDNCYYLYFESSTAYIYLYKKVASTVTRLAQSTGQYATGTLKIAAAGTTLSAYRNGALIVTATDTDLAAIGSVGLAVNTGSNIRNQLDNFIATEATSGITAAAAILDGIEGFAATGAINISASMAAAEPADVLAVAGAIGISGSAAMIEGGEIVLASGVVAVSSAITLVNAADVLAASGGVTISGMISIADGPDVFLAGVSVINGVMATIAIAAAPDAVVAVLVVFSMAAVVERILNMRAENRSLAIAAESRLLPISQESRILIITQE